MSTAPDFLHNRSLFSDDVYMMVMTLSLYRRKTKARRGDEEYGRLSEEAERHESKCTHGHSLHHVTGRWKSFTKVRSTPFSPARLAFFSQQEDFHQIGQKV